MIAKLLNINIGWSFVFGVFLAVFRQICSFGIISFSFSGKKMVCMIILRAERGNKLAVSQLDTGKINLSLRMPDQRAFAPNGLVHHTVKIRAIYRTLICLVIA